MKKMGYQKSHFFHVNFHYMYVVEYHAIVCMRAEIMRVDRHIIIQKSTNFKRQYNINFATTIFTYAKNRRSIIFIKVPL